MTARIRALNDHGRQRSKDVRVNTDYCTKSCKKSLSLNEIYSNIFKINFACRDTTANTLCFAMHPLAANPDVQFWPFEEIVFVVQEVSDWD